VPYEAVLVLVAIVSPEYADIMGSPPLRRRLPPAWHGCVSPDRFSGAGFHMAQPYRRTHRGESAGPAGYLRCPPTAGALLFPRRRRAITVPC